jgi:hypothetical protein
MKKKLNTRNPRTDATIPGVSPPTATVRTTRVRKLKPSVSGVRSPRNGWNDATIAAVPTVASRYPATSRVLPWERNPRVDVSASG